MENGSAPRGEKGRPKESRDVKGEEEAGARNASPCMREGMRGGLGEEDGGSKHSSHGNDGKVEWVAKEARRHRTERERERAGGTVTATSALCVARHVPFPFMRQPSIVGSCVVFVVFFFPNRRPQTIRKQHNAHARPGSDEGKVKHREARKKTGAREREEHGVAQRVLCARARTRRGVGAQAEKDHL